MKLELYRKLDLIFLTVLALSAEGLGIWLNSKFPGAGYYLSFSSLIAIIALLRWGTYGIVVNLSLALLSTFLGTTLSIQIIVFYLVSNTAAIIVPKIFKKVDTSEIVSKSYYLFGYVMAFYGIIIVSRGLLGSLLHMTFYETVMVTLSQTLFSMIMSYLVLLLLKGREGLLVNMMAYFINEQKEIKE
jgi:hypothetical protein